MRFTVGLVAVAALVACKKPASIQLDGAPPTVVWSSAPAELPNAVALDAEGAPLPDAPVSVRLEPKVLGTLSGRSVSATNHGSGRVIWSVNDTDVELAKPIEMRVPDAVDVRCPTSGCDIGLDTTLTLSGSVRRGTEVLEGARLEWKVSDPAVLELVGPGRVKAISPGWAEVSAHFGTLRRAVKVRVSPKEVDDITLKCAADGSGKDGVNAPCRVRISRPRPLEVEMSGDRHPVFGVEPKWTVADRSVARVVGRELRGEKIGSTRVTVGAGDVEASIDVEVWPPPCGSQIDGMLTYYLRSGGSRRRVTLACRIKEPEPCLDFYGAKYKDVSAALEGCCCSVHVR